MVKEEKVSNDAFMKEMVRIKANAVCLGVSSDLEVYENEEGLFVIEYKEDKCSIFQFAKKDLKDDYEKCKSDMLDELKKRKEDEINYIG